MQYFNGLFNSLCFPLDYKPMRAGMSDFFYLCIFKALYFLQEKLVYKKHLINASSLVMVQVVISEHVGVRGNEVQ